MTLVDGTERGQVRSCAGLSTAGSDSCEQWSGAALLCTSPCCCAGLDAVQDSSSAAQCCVGMLGTAKPMRCAMVWNKGRLVPYCSFYSYSVFFLHSLAQSKPSAKQILSFGLEIRECLGVLITTCITRMPTCFVNLWIRTALSNTGNCSGTPRHILSSCYEHQIWLVGSGKP